MIRQQSAKCESVTGVKTAETGEDVVTCQDHGDEYVYKIIPGADGPIVAMIDYSSGMSSAQPATESATSARMPLPPDTTTDCDGPFYAEYQGTSSFSPICQSEIATAHAALRKAKLPCDALVFEWRDEPAQSPMMELECFVADDSTYGSSPVFYDTGRGPFKAVTQDEWLRDLKCARGAHGPFSDSEYAELKAACGPSL
jgi:hypothetical protein